jgi:2-oxoglutarate ferredoxin oxidoreductase subunit alpha
VAINDDFLRKDYPIIERKRPAPNNVSGYLRYELTPDLISPMADVGAAGLVYQTTGLSHNEEGVPAFDLETNQLFHEKRWRKLLPLAQRDDLCKVFGNSLSSKGIITWGSSAQAVLAAMKDLGLENEVKVCIPELLHPLPDKVKDFIGSAQRLLIIEMNYSGQFHNYLRSQLDLPKQTTVYRRAGGRPFTSKELREPIEEVLK